jgi:hypothetical protein
MVGVKMADYENSKTFGTMAYPVNAIEVTPLLRRVEPILTPKKLESRYLKGLEHDYSVAELKDEITLAMNRMEVETNLDFTKVQRMERHPFDRNLYQSYVHFKTKRRPILSIESLAIASSDGGMIYELPPTWLDMGHCSNGQINVVPLLQTWGNSNVPQGVAQNAGLVFLSATQSLHWMPSFFTIKYTTGLCHEEGKLPVIVNDLIGCDTAIEILSNMQNRNILSSQSISQDGISQSSSSPSTQVYQPRIDFLMQKREKLKNEIKAEFASKYYIANI